MNAYSSDLRERVIAAANETALTQPEIAATFSVSLSSVEAWLRTFRSVGRSNPLPRAGGTPRRLQPHATLLSQIVAQQPDATLGELCMQVAAKTGVSANASMMCRELQHLRLPRKKVTARQPTRNRTRPKTAG
jgi:transposase